MIGNEPGYIQDIVLGCMESLEATTVLYVYTEFVQLQGAGMKNPIQLTHQEFHPDHPKLQVWATHDGESEVDIHSILAERAVHCYRMLRWLYIDYIKAKTMGWDVTQQLWKQHLEAEALAMATTTQEVLHDFSLTRCESCPYQEHEWEDEYQEPPFTNYQAIIINTNDEDPI